MFVEKWLLYPAFLAAVFGLYAAACLAWHLAGEWLHERRLRRK